MTTINIISNIIDGIYTIYKVGLDMIFGDREFEYLFKQLKLENKDEHKPILRKTIDGVNYTAYLFTIPIGLSIDDFMNNKMPISQYLHQNYQDVNIELVNNQALITIKKENLNISYDYESYEFDEELKIPLGINLLNKKIMSWNFSEPNEYHLILGGTTGCGKSTMLRMMITHIIKHLSNKVELRLQDTKIVDLPDFKDVTCVTYYEEYKDGIYEQLNSLVDEMTSRYKLIKESKSRDIRGYNEKNKNKLKYIFLIIEELSSFSKENKEDKEGFYIKLKDILTKGRSAGIQVIFTCQTPYNDVFPGDIKNNVNVKVGLACNTGEASKSICGDYDALLNLKGKGHGKLFSCGNICEFQGLNIQEETICDVVDKNTKPKINNNETINIGVKIKEGHYES